MPKRNARPGFPSEPSRRSDRAVSTLLVSSHSKPLINKSSQEESVIRSDEVASSAPAKRRRSRTARWRGMTVGVASLTAMLSTALVPGLGSAPAGATGPTVTTIAGHSHSTAPSLGVPAAPGSAKISPTYVAYNPSNGDTAVASTQAGSVYVYLIAGAGSEANEYNIQTAPNPTPAFGSLTSGDAYLVAGTGTAGLIAQPGNNQYGNSTTAVATANPITPTSVAFDPNGNLLIAGENGSTSAIQVVAKTTGTFYGVSMTAGDLYTIADVGVSGAPSSAINMGAVAAPANGMSVDSSGNIVVGNGIGVDFVNESLGQPQPLRQEHRGPVLCDHRRLPAGGAPTARREPPVPRRRRSISRVRRPSSTAPTTSTSPTTRAAVPTAAAVTGSSRRSRAPSTASASPRATPTSSPATVAPRPRRTARPGSTPMCPAPAR